jgi:YbbR domain-containing protein
MVLSLFLSFILWLAVSGRETAPHEVKASLNFINLPQDLYVDTAEFPSEVTITVEANTAQFQLMEGPRKYSVTVDLGHSTDGENARIIDPDTMLDPPLPRGVLNIKVQPAELIYEAYPYAERELPVYAPLFGKLPDYLELTENVMITPATAKVRAPINRIDTITRVTTNSIDLNQVLNNSNAFPLFPSLPGFNSWVHITPDKFTAHVPVAFLNKEATFTLPIKLLGLSIYGPELPVIVEPRDAKVTVTYRADRPDKPQESDISLSVDFASSKDIDRSEPQEMDIAVSVSPGLTVKVEPPQVTVIWKNAANFRQLETSPESQMESNDGTK